MICIWPRGVDQNGYGTMFTAVIATAAAALLTSNKSKKKGVACKLLLLLLDMQSPDQGRDCEASGRVMQVSSSMLLLIKQRAA